MLRSLVQVLSVRDQKIVTIQIQMSIICEAENTLEGHTFQPIFSVDAFHFLFFEYLHYQVSV
jgi:hypothetical protein